MSENADLPENRRMVFRIGINLGDVIEEGERIYGDGVNIAARIESLAAGGGICISGTAFDHVEGKLDLEFEYLGEQSVKNIRKPVRVYRVKMATGVSGFGIGRELPLPDKPSIAVLPFVNMSGDPAQEYIGDGLSENIIGALSISSKMFVIARNSTFSYKGRHVKVQQVSEEMGVQYVLEGSVQKSGDRLRVTAQLIDALSGHHLWSDKYDRKMIELFDLQDEITKKIVTSLQVKLTHGEAARWAERTTESFEAWSYFVRGRELYMKFGKEHNAKARELLEEATRLDPEYAYAWGVLGGTHLMDAWRGWSESPSNSMKLGRDYVQKSLELDERSPVGHGLLGHLYLMQGEHDKAMAEHKKTLSFHPNHDMAHFDLGASMCFSGRFEESIELIEKAMRLSPYYPAIYLYFLGINYISLKRLEEAIEIFTQLNERCERGDFPAWNAYRGLAECYWELGRKEEAREYLAKLLKANPRWSLESLRMDPFPFKDLALVQPSIEIFRELGAPEKPSLPLPDKPSIAVLPFVNMSGDPEQEYFSDGMTEEIITWLSKIPGLFVTARNSTFTFKGQPVRVREVGQELGVRYIMEGSVRKSGDRVRVTAQLIDVKTEQHVWADRYERELKDVFAIQDEITMNIIVALQVELTEGDQAALRARGTYNLEAYLKFLQAMDYFKQLSKESNILARQKCQEAVTMAPEYASAYAGIAWTHLIEPWLGWSDSPPHSLKLAMEYAQKCLAMDESYSGAHAALGLVYLVMRQWDKAVEKCELAVSLHPNSADNIVFLAMAYRAVGRVEEALALLNRAVRINPMPPDFYLHEFGSCYRLMGRYDEAIAMLKRVLDRNPDYLSSRFNLIATYVMSGKDEAARAEAVEVLSQSPDFSVERFLMNFPYKDQKILDGLKECLLKAGLK
jgi:adenylate cyclase